MKRLFHHRFAGGCVSVEWEPRDLWLGAYWKRSDLGRFHVYLNFVPCLPIHLTLDSPADGWSEEPPPDCCDYRDHATGLCFCTEHDHSVLHPYGYGYKIVADGWPEPERRHVPPGSAYARESPNEMLARVVMADKTGHPEESPTDSGLTSENEQDVPLPMHRGGLHPGWRRYYAGSAIDGDPIEQEGDL